VEQAKRAMGMDRKARRGASVSFVPQGSWPNFVLFQDRVETSFIFF